MEILLEWEGGCFFSDESLSEVYSEFLLHLLDASDCERQDPRIPAFLRAGFEAYTRDQFSQDPEASNTYQMALAMVGGGNTDGPTTPPRPATPVLRPPSPFADPTTPPATQARGATPRDSPTSSPKPGPSKRPREQDADECGEQPTLEVLQSCQRELKRFRASFREEVMLVRGLGSTLPSEEIMEGMFDAMLTRQREAVQAKDDDRVIVEIQNGESAENPLWFNMRRTDQINGRVVLDKLSRVLNSNQGFMANGQLKISYIHIPTPHAGGRRSNCVANESMEQWLERTS